MTLIQSMLDSPYTHRLGWALLHSLWEGAAVALVLMLLLFLTRKAAAQVRYVASCGAMVAVFALPVVTFFWLGPQTPSSTLQQSAIASARSSAPATSGEPASLVSVHPLVVHPAPDLSAPATPAPVQPAARPWWTPVVDRLQASVPWLVLAWAAGVAGLSLWNLGGWAAIQRLKFTSTGNVEREICDLSDRLRARLDLHRTVTLLRSARVVSPMVIGVVKPVILLPASVLCELSAAQLESILAHELAHIRRHDYLANLLQSVIETLMFYHPAVWWIGRRIRIERENCCDDIALSLTRDRVNYVRALTLVAARAPGLAPAATGGVLLARVRRILGLPAADIVGAPRWLSGALVLALALAFGAVLRPHAPAANAAPAKAPQTQPDSPIGIWTWQEGKKSVIVLRITAVQGQTVTGSITSPSFGGGHGPYTLTLGLEDATFHDGTLEFITRYGPNVTRFVAKMGADALIGTYQTNPNRPPTVFRARREEPGADKAQAYVAGQVRDASGQGVANVFLETHFGAEGHMALSGPDGHFSLDLSNQDRPIGFRNLWAHTGDGKLQAFAYQVDSDSPLPRDNLQLTLAPARQFDVSVVDADGKPLGNAWIAGCADYMLVGESRSNADGHATLRVPVGAPLMYVLALKPGLAIDYFAFWGPREIHNNPYRLAQDYAGPLRFVLERANAVTIRVVDGDHHPLADVAVNPWYFMKPQKGGDLNLFANSHFTQITDAQGRARFDWIPPDNQQKINFWTRLDGYAEKDRCLYDPKAAPAELEQTMRKLVHVTGRVLDQEGHPAPSVIVRVGGDGYQMDQFTGQVTTDARGEFVIDVNPEQFYIFVCSVGKLATTPVERIVHDKPPAEDVVLELEPGVRIHGTATMGSDHRPVPHTNIGLIQQDYDGYLHRPASEQFSGGVNGRKAIIPSANLAAATTDSQGRFEFYASPGRFYVSGFFGGTPVIEHFAVANETEHEVNLQAQSTGPQHISGRVVLAGNPSVAVPEATIEGAPLGMEHLARVGQGISDKAGDFTVLQGKFDLYLCATTRDGLRGLTLVKSSQKTATIAVGPTASIRARLVDPAGQPIINRPITYGFHVSEGPNGRGPFRWAFGDTVTTDEQGFFTAAGLIPGYEYELNAAMEFNPEGQPRMWHTVRKVKAEKAHAMDLKDLILPPAPKPKTPKDLALEAFRPAKSFEHRLAAAQHVAAVSFQRVLVLLGSPSNAAVQSFFRYRYDQGTPELSRALANFFMLPVDIGAADAAAARTWAGKNGISWPAGGLTLVVLDPGGRVIAQKADAALSSNGALDPGKLADFARQNVPQLPDARRLLDEALARAAREHKNVLLDESAPYCGWCVKLTDYLDANRAVIDKYFVRVMLDRRFAGGKQIMERLRSPRLEDRYSTPWTAILSPDQRVLITSDAATGNIGYPGEPGGRVHWKKMLRTGAPQMTESELAGLLVVENAPK